MIVFVRGIVLMLPLGTVFAQLVIVKDVGNPPVECRWLVSRVCWFSCRGAVGLRVSVRLTAHVMHRLDPLDLASI